MTTLAQHRASIEAATATLAAGRRALLDPNGTRLYSDAEHQRREDRLHETFEATLAEATEAAQAAITTAAGVLDQGEPNPIHKLSTADLERASLLRSLLRDRLLTAPIRDVDSEVQAVLTSGDRASRYAVWQLVSERRQLRVDAAIAAAPDLTGRLRAEHGPEAGPLGSMAERLYATLVDPTVRAEVNQQAEATRQEALTIVNSATVTGYLQSEYGPSRQGWRPGVEVA